MISKEEIKKQFTSKNVTDYTYSIIFFITFSFFAFVVIKPNITMIFSLQRELQELKLIDDSYNNVIDKILTIQTSLETTRDTIGVLDEALPIRPNVNKLVDDIKKVSSNSGVTIDELTVSEINLKNKVNLEGYKKISINFSASAGFEETYKFIRELVNQRRLKGISNISFTKDNKEGSASGTINVKLSVEGFYL